MSPAEPKHRNSVDFTEFFHYRSATLSATPAATTPMARSRGTGETMATPLSAALALAWVAYPS
jgi:hypothetical protein